MVGTRPNAAEKVPLMILPQIVLKKQHGGEKNMCFAIKSASARVLDL
jgi:hypothetical protein